MPQRPTRVRHVVLWLTVAAYMITYMDRVVISATAPLIKEEFGFTAATMGAIFASFRLAYSLFQIPGAWFGDVFGPRKSLSLIVLWWSAFTSLTVWAWNATSMIAIRFLFGMGEAGAFPIATRSLSRWMLPSERGYAQGITHAGSRLGAALTPPLVVALAAAYGWRAPFLVFGALGVAWALVWFLYYRDTPAEHSGPNEAEKEMIHSALGGPRPAKSGNVPWKTILASSTLWTLSAMYFCYGYCLAVYLDWFPTYLREHRGMTLTQMGIYASLPLVAGLIGDLAGGWISDWLVERTSDLRRARSWCGVAGFCLAAAGILPATLTQSPELCVLFSCVAVFGIEFTVGVSWAIPLDIGGDFAGSVSSVMNTCGNLGGTLSTFLLGTLASSYGWNVPFLAAAVLCLLGALLYARIDATRRIAYAN